MLSWLLVSARPKALWCRSISISCLSEGHITAVLHSLHSQWVWWTLCFESAHAFYYKITQLCRVESFWQALKTTQGCCFIWRTNPQHSVKQEAAKPLKPLRHLCTRWNMCAIFTFLFNFRVGRIKTHKRHISFDKHIPNSATPGVVWKSFGISPRTVWDSFV